ncbi:YdhK family protein [Brachybacterium paraconglomeratum]|uniref:YdhK family protein n=1 Tax=Brachybacterium paraconglomeratum TaxID=173362 RepID=UPI0024913D46|nr:YdhK family protein [Brachybacterium paraconglomeratum]
MRRKVTTALAAGILGGALMLSGCTSSDQDSPSGNHQGDHGNDEPGSSDGGMDHPMDGGPAPVGIEDATSPEYPVGTEVTLTADHMEGMDGATATIAGAYDTYTYSVNYTPDGGDAVTDHKWVVQEEIKDAGDQRLADGTEVTLEAEHMEGMKDAKATIASSTDEVVYMVDYESEGMTMTNHKWVTESEIQPAS